MEQAKRERLESKGWKIGTVSDFLELTREETILIEIKKILNQIRDKNSKARDLEIDNLSTLLEYEQLSNVEQIYVVEELIKILREESDPAVIESIFNLLGIAFDNDVCSDDIVKISTEMLNILEPNSLVHVILIIGCSELENREELIEPFLSSNNPAVKSEAEETLLMIRKYPTRA